MDTQRTGSETGRLSQEDGPRYLASLQALAGELDRAMKAIANRELRPLQESVRLQQAACAHLEHIARRSTNVVATSADRSSSLPGRAMDGDLADEIRSAAETLLNLNRTYAALLKHSGDTLRLFAGLYRGYHGPARASASNQAGPSTWSCEL